MSSESKILVGNSPLKYVEQEPVGAFVEMLGEAYYQIQHVDQMPPFFVNLVSGSNLWLFIASNGGLTAGRTNVDSALFPYETEDKLMANRDRVGSTTLLRVMRQDQSYLWLPFALQYADLYDCEHNLYKNVTGNKILFEAINHDLQLTWRTAWRTSDRFGFVKSSWLRNDGDPTTVTLLDGLQNVLPYGASNHLQTNFSNLLHAYKRSELDTETGLGIFALSATLTDQAEPSESLMATLVWQVGLTAVTHLLSTEQMAAFRRGQPITAECDVRGKPGAYLVQANIDLASGAARAWHIVADVDQNRADVVKLKRMLRQDPAVIIEALEVDIDRTTAVLVDYVAAADGLQHSADVTTTAHHFANVLFNILRGGIFYNGYQLDTHDLVAFVRVRNRPLLQARRSWFEALPEQLDIGALYARAEADGSPDLIRVCYEYLPLTFSRRHGDPSRPWNRFDINLRQPDGSPRLDYQGNWRDIFQNWEPLALSFPVYTRGMIAKFLNATTADGYNPYRITRDGIEWEVPEPENPWANIGYWNDHQIIYLQKLLEVAEKTQPGSLHNLWHAPIFAVADVPYRIRPYREMLSDWYNTIDFDWEQEEATEAAVAEMGTDGRLRRNEAGNVIHVTMAEKLLVLLLTKLSNFVPDGGIWMNTQRPEWNDANNALVGKGISVVTTAYLRRFVTFWQAQLAHTPEDETFVVNTAVAELFEQVLRTLEQFAPHLESGFDGRARRDVMDALGEAATAYRAAVYADSDIAAQRTLTGSALRRLLAIARQYIDQTLRANRRPDDLYHAYNILRLDEETAAVDTLYVMLEGQVAILSSGLLTAQESLALLRSMRDSDLYRADQHTYMLYPNRDLPGFQQKNNVPAEKVAHSALVAALMANGDTRLLNQDVAGDYHFNGRFRNEKDVVRVLDALAQEPAYAALVAAERSAIVALFEETFNHSAFTGRSGTFFAYEGLGSVYWHMVSKLLLATQESYLAARAEGAETAVVTALADAYYDIRDGLGFNKSPAEYGAFPTDPYSHTPWGNGARQPGMTGMVKEEILTRLGELGVFIEGGQLCFEPTLLRPTEFLAAATDFEYVDAAGKAQRMTLPAGALAFTFCQTPVVYQRGVAPQIEVVGRDGRSATRAGSRLDVATTRHIFNRDGQVKQLLVTVPAAS